MAVCLCSRTQAMGCEPLCRAPRQKNRHRRERRRVSRRLRLSMPIVRILLVLLALASPAFAQDGARDAADAREAAQAFRVYAEGVTKKAARPDLTRPEVAALLGRVFNLDGLAAPPPAQASDMNWLMDWTDAANATHKLFTFYGAKPGPQPD